MNQQQLWAPWRLPYIKSAKDDKGGGCFLCRCGDSPDDTHNLVVARDEHSLVVLNRFPYNNGHLLIAPLAHKGALDELNDEELLSCGRQMQKMTRALGEVLSPQGFNVGLNLGQVAGAGLPGHLHWHVVPRWNGDTNFMSVLGDVNVIPQSLEALYESLARKLSE